MNEDILKAVEDAYNDEVPEDLTKLDKIKCHIKNGTRLWWYYKEDVEYLEEYGEDGEDVRSGAGYSGIAISVPGVSYNGTIDEYIIVVIDTYPVEKEYCEIDWIALNRLIDNDEIVEVFTREPAP